MKKILQTKAFRITVRLLPFLLSVFLIYRIIGTTELAASEFLEQYEPQSYFLAILFFFLMCALKSLSVVFPSPALNIAAGIIFEPLPAVIISSIGVMITCAVPYWIGRISGSSFFESFVSRRPKIQEFLSGKMEQPWFLAYFLRIIRIFPIDLVSMYLGCAGVPFLTYMTASAAGLLPTAIFTTLIGAAINDPASPMFIVSIIMTVAITVLSLILNRLYKKKKYELKAVSFAELKNNFERKKNNFKD